MTERTREDLLYAAIWTAIVGYIVGCIYALYLTGWLAPVAGSIVIGAAVIAIGEQHKEQQVEKQARARRWREW